jgi:Tfp pilus assembly protein PilF
MTGEYDLAIQHCRHILQQHPQHVASYRLLAKALLEQGDHSGAAELFQRILSADPNDHIAHAGLAIIYQEEDVLSQSLWHLERAHEIEPYNAAIQQELRALRARQSSS